MSVSIIVPNQGPTITYSVASQAAMLALQAKLGDIAVRSDISQTFILTTTDPSQLANWTVIAVTADTGVIAMAAVGAAPNANGASISGSTLTLQPASASFPGVVTAGTQTFAGSKTLGNAAGDAITIGAASSTAVHPVRGGMTRTTRSISGNLTIDTTTTDNFIFADTSGGVISITLPPPVAGRAFKLIDSTNSFPTNNLTIVRNGSEKINNVAASKVLSGGGPVWTILTDGTNWFVG